MQSERQWSFDWLLVVLTLMLLGLGLLMIDSATANINTTGLPLWDVPVIRQGLFAVVGLVGLIIVSLINYRVWGVWRWLLYLGMAVALAAVLITARASFGARSWFNLEAFSLQPSELCKLVLIISLARHLADREPQVKRGQGLITSLLVAAPFLVLVFAQPDMGTAVVLFAIWLGMLFVAGLRPLHILALVVAALVLAPLLWHVMQDHQRERIMMFLHPNTSPLGKDYNPIQALIGVGSGGMWGKGLGQGTQSQLAFLRVRHTDFIFAVLAEELGFVGALLLITLFASLLLRIIQVGARTDDAYGRLLATGVAIMIFVQVAVSIGFHVGLLPVTGLPLPLISAGGSSLVTTLLGLGLVESVALYRQTSASL